MDGAEHGVILLAMDGLSHRAAEHSLSGAGLWRLRSTFPSTSTTAWLTAVTGAGAAEHGAIGMVYRAPGADHATHLITGDRIAFDPPGPGTAAGEPIVPHATVFDRCAARGTPAVAVGAELNGLRGPWVTALLHGARLLPTPRTPLSTDPVAVVARVVAEVDAVPPDPSTGERPPLIWAYVNLDDHIHQAGYDERLHEAVRLLDTAARRWARAGRSVVAHADHGQTRVARDPALHDAWARLDAPEHCLMPGGGAGRTRWLYPRPGRERELADRLADALGDHARVYTPAELDAAGLLPATPAVLERIGAVVAVAATARFPVPDPRVGFEHGALTQEETHVPLAGWGAALDAIPPALAGATR
ncbi:alkaline phosphatase family protein [Streptantibioticus silvisoli]|uniref:Alkaline phosphatase family protein n=1 Tax=Streptantibioticus silvisoli TaxID=2705255 RepID=A0ABT6VX64_9ACTN|nr:alkaline phosphatase family protein [Streptantibioticus silvisoli]MDI5962327.1 alkaline phosphatase family protein [Streptantibioticus silvisoli]